MSNWHYSKLIPSLLSILFYSLTTTAQTADPATDPHVESHIKVFLQAVNSGTGKPIEQLSPAEGRAVLVSVQKSVDVDMSGVDVSERNITADGQMIKLTIVRPAGIKSILPVFMFFHGGGWVLGDYPTHARLVRDLVFYSGAVAVFVNYTPSPEAKFPVAVNQAYAATKWVAEHGKEINVDPSRLAIAGNSVGGNMTAVVALMAREKKGPAIRFQLLLWPVTDASFETASYQQFEDKYFLTKTVMQYYWDSYTVNLEERKSIYASPLQASIDQLKGLPAALIQVAENDVLRDEGEAYGRKLDQAGVPVAVTRFNGMIHDFGLLNPLATVPGVRAHVMQAGAALKSHLK